MFPLRDNIPTVNFPLLTVLLIVINTAVFLYSQSRPAEVLPVYDRSAAVAVNGFDAFTAEWGFVPCELTNRCQAPDAAALPTAEGACCITVRVPEKPALLTLFTSMFMHGGWLHLLG